MPMKSVNLQQLLDRQARRWDLEHRERPEQRRAPCVAISRLPSAGGKTLGQRAAEWLDYGFFGKEILDEIAREKGIRQDLLRGLDERVGRGIDRFVADTLRLRSFTESDYLQHVVRTIATLGHRGRTVIVGRGAPFILSPEDALRVLVVAPTPVRVERLARARDLPTDRAAAELARQDAERREFSRVQFGVNQEDPLLYDLVVNTAGLEIDAGARLIIEALQQRFALAG